MDKSTEKDAYDDSKENMVIPKTCMNDFEENNDVKLENSSDSDEKQKDLKESPKKFSCPKCQKLFKTKRILKIHILCVHEKRKDYICKTCKKPFFTSTHDLVSLSPNLLSPNPKSPTYYHLVPLSPSPIIT